MSFLRSGLIFLGVVLLILLILVIGTLFGGIGHPPLIAVLPVFLIKPTFIGKIFAFFGPEALFGKEAYEFWFLLPLACAALVEYFIVGGGHVRTF